MLNLQKSSIGQGRQVKCRMIFLQELGKAISNDEAFSSGELPPEEFLKQNLN